MYDVTWKHPFTCSISGSTGSGKSEWCFKFIRHIEQMMSPVPDEIIWCYGVWQKGYEDMQRRGVVFLEGIPDISDWNIDKRRLVIIDDLMHETNAALSQLFTKGSHHKNISVMYIVQNLFAKNKESRTISLNSHYMVVFKNPRDCSQIIHLGRQMFPGEGRYVTEAFKSATSRPYGYLLFDLRQDTSDQLRLRTNIFPGEEHTVFVPKRH